MNQTSLRWVAQRRVLLKFLCVLATSCASIGNVPAQQVVDSSFNFQIKSPAFPSGQGPRVLVDGGHFNFHSITSTYGPFANLLRADGYIVDSPPFDSSPSPFTAELLGTAQILVIPNALNEINNVVNSWNLPTPSAFSDAEIALILEWVKGGGSFLLIADHMPFAGAAEKVASAFGIHFSNGFAVDAPGLGSSVSEISAKVEDPVTFSRSNGLLADHLITKGVRSSDEKIDFVTTFTGSAFQADPGVAVQPLMTFSPFAKSLLPNRAWQFLADTPVENVGGWLHGAVLEIGKGRVAVFGEAAMFSAQINLSTGKKMGMNAPGAEHNPPFVLNLLHWLSGLKPAQVTPELTSAAVYPQLALGGGFQVVVLVSNATDAIWEGTLLLRQGNNQDWSSTWTVNAAEQPGLSFFNFSLAPHATQKFLLSGDNQARAGYLQIGNRNNSTVDGIAPAFFYNFGGAGDLLDSTGVGSSAESFRFLFPVERNSAVNTGFAWASKVTTSFNVRLKLFDADGKQREEKIVPFNGHLARFFPEVFDSVAGNFTGKVLIEAEQKIYLTVLRLESRSDGTFQLTSVPPQAR